MANGFIGKGFVASYKRYATAEKVLRDALTAAGRTSDFRNISRPWLRQPARIRSINAMVASLYAYIGRTPPPKIINLSSPTDFGKLQVQIVAIAATVFAGALPTKPLNFITEWGDSRSAATYLDGSQRNRSVLSPLNWANDLGSAGYLVGPTFGVSGERSDQALARVNAVIASGAGTVRIMMGVNNFGQTFGAQTYIHAVSGAVIGAAQVAAQTFADVKSAIERIRAGGAQVVMELEVGANNLDAAGAANVRAFNAMLADLPKQDRFVFLHNTRSIVLADQNAAIPQFKTGYSEDGTHLNGRGSYYAGKSLRQLLLSIAPVQYFTLPARSAIPLPAAGRLQLVNNPIFATGTGGQTQTLNAANTSTTTGSTTIGVTIAGGLPIGVAVSGTGIPANTTVVSGPANGGPGNYELSNAATATGTITLSAVTVQPASVVPGACVVATVGRATLLASVGADQTGTGNNAILQPVFAAANDAVRFFSDVAVANWAAGDIVEGVAEVVVTGAANLKSVQLELSISGLDAGSAQVGTPTIDLHTGASNTGPDEDYVVTLRTKTVQIPATMTTKQFMSIGLRALAARAAAAGATSIRIRSMYINRYVALPY